MSTLTATGGVYDAGIEVNAGSTVTIHGGKVTATGEYGAGIGGGAGGSYDGDGGNFTADGNAFITASRIDDQSGKNGAWSGVIFEGTENGKVYGSEITLAADAEILTGKTLEIGGGQTLIVGEDVTLTNSGTITGSGTIKGKVIGSGTIEDGITVQDHTHQWDTAWSSDATNHWRRCTVTGCGERSDTAAHTPGDWIVDQAATSTDAGSRHKACTVCGYVTATETIPATGGDGGGYIPPVTPTYPPRWNSPARAAKLRSRPQPIPSGATP